ncbi:hypothetical protein CVT26_012522 [Gymnopilus dilepis]|uniref:Uncharacterized protein n=1 Tax=Gymnopilus dilepis TaxID=231916 RepID=A0A409WAJ6_9AGAR|nr:hypothetical protein CVT26_012522 [Gymnopilus dilepis]
MFAIGAISLLLSYLRDISLLFLGSILLLVCHIWFSRDSLGAASVSCLLPESSLIRYFSHSEAADCPDFSLMPTGVLDTAWDESFLMVPSSSLSVDDFDQGIEYPSNYGRLRARSVKMIQTFAKERYQRKERGGLQGRKVVEKLCQLRS